MGTLAEISILNDALTISKLKSQLVLDMADLEAVTDELANKNTVYINDILSNLEFISFTDYIIEDFSGTLNYSNTSGSGTFLTNLIIKGSDVKIETVNTPHVNVMIMAEDGSLNQSGSIHIIGTATGKNILVRAVNTDSHALQIVDNDLSDEDDDYSLEGSLFDIVSDVAINIGPNGKLIATQTVNLEALSEQTKPLIPTLEELTAKFGDEFKDTLNINFMAVKVGSAIIDIQGSIEAAAIRALANSLVNVSPLNDNLANFGMPLAIGVVVSQAGISARDNAQLKSSSGGIFLRADSDVNLATHAVSGLLPFVLAVSAVVNDAYVDIKGNTQVNSQGDTTASAYGWTNISTSASGPKTTSGTGSTGSNTAGKSGGFFAVSVAVQNVFASISENASATTGGNLTLSSLAHERVKNEATSNPDDGGTSFTLANLINKVNSLLAKSSTQTKQGSTGNRSSSGLRSVTSRLSGAGGTGTTDLVNTGTAGVTGNGQAGTTSSTQLVGALAVSYAENINKAFIDTMGTIKSQGTLGVQANSSTVNETLADGSPIKRTSAGATGVSNPDAGAPAPDTGMSYEGRTQGKVVFATTQNGFLTIDKTQEQDQTPDAEITITTHPNDGYKLESITVNGTPLTAVGGVYKFTMPADGSNVTLAATFVPKAYTITSSNVNAGAGTFYTSPRYGDEGDSIIIHVTPNDGYTIGEIKITYKDASGNEQSRPYTDIGNNQYRFTMPAADVTVTVSFEGVNKVLYIDSGISNGTISVKDSDGNVIVSNASGSASEKEVQVGTVLTVEITPAQGHRLKANSLKIGTTVILPDASGVYKFSMPWTQADRIGLGAIFEPGTPTTSTSSRTSSRALGVGVGIAVVNHSNQAYINAAPSSVEAGSLDISAESSNISSSAISRSGFTAADLGLAGALTVHVVSGCNSAELNRNLVLSNNGSINLRANVLKSDFITVADAAGTSAGTASGTTPTGSPASDSVGIGAGIAIGVIGVDSYASIADTVSISPASSDTVLDSMNVTASYQGSEQMIAKAGASGGTAIVPVLALDISGIYVAANTGINTADAELTFNNDINVTAFSEMTRSILADAAAVGGGVGFAGSFIVDIINDGAVATLGRSVRGKRVWVKADSVSRVTANGKAGASGGTSQTSNNGQSGGTGSGSGSGSGSGGGGDSGGSDDSEDPGSGDSDEDDPYAGIADLFNEDGENDPPEEDDYSDAFARLFNEGEADAIADANTQAAANLASVVGTQNVNSNIVNSLTANRQKAETAEGSVQVAATFTLNIQRNNCQID
jgi:hypothetical protein